MSPIKDLNVICIAANEDGTFSQGDVVEGAVTFRLTKDVKVKSVSLKVKGDANAQWSSGDINFISHRRYFKVKEYLVEKSDKETVLPQGVNTLIFMFKIPECDMPSSFEGNDGRIVYKFEAKISRSWQWSSQAQKEIKFVSRFCPPTTHLMCPQSGSVSKTISGLSKGQVQMSATINRGVCSPGETLSVVAKIFNSSSKDMRPKFKLKQKTVYSCEKHTNIMTKTLLKMVGDTISPKSEKAVSCQLKIPDDAIPTLHNCEIISVEYYIKVCLDISFAIDPEVVFPLVIVPSRFSPVRAGETAEKSEDEGD